MQPHKSCWSHTVALCISARQPQKFSNEFHIHVLGTVRECRAEDRAGHGAWQRYTRLVLPTERSLWEADVKPAVLSMLARWGPLRHAWARIPTAGGTARSSAVSTRRAAAWIPLSGSGGSAGPVRPPAGRGGACPCLLPQEGLRGCAAASRNFWFAVPWPRNETRPTRPSKLSGGCSGCAGPGRARTPLPRGTAQGRRSLLSRRCPSG